MLLQGDMPVIGAGANLDAVGADAGILAAQRSGFDVVTHGNFARRVRPDGG